MKLSFLLSTFTVSCTAISSVSRICDPGRIARPNFTGFRFDFQTSFNSDVSYIARSYYLVLCKEGHPISDIRYELDPADAKIPWDKTLCTTDRGNCYKLARSKETMLKARPFMSTFPGETVGGLFELSDYQAEVAKDENYLPVSRLLQDSLTSVWFEIHLNRDLFTAHFPLFHTFDPNSFELDSDFFLRGADQWESFISANEDYKFESQDRTLMEKANEQVNSKIAQVINDSNKKFSSIVSRFQKKLSTIANSALNVQEVVKKRKATLFPKIFKSKIETLSKLKGKLNPNEIDLDTMIVLSKVLQKEKFEELLKSIDQVYANVPLKKEIFKYPTQKKD